MIISSILTMPQNEYSSAKLALIKLRTSPYGFGDKFDHICFQSCPGEVKAILKEEEELFLQTLDRGCREFESIARGTPRTDRLPGLEIRRGRNCF